MTMSMTVSYFTFICGTYHACRSESALFVIAVLLLAVGLSSARWVRRDRANQPRVTSFVGDATNELSTAIFQVWVV